MSNSLYHKLARVYVPVAVYVNSVLATLNSRNYLRRGTDHFHTMSFAANGESGTRMTNTSGSDSHMMSAIGGIPQGREQTVTIDLENGVRGHDGSVSSGVAEMDPK